MKNDLTIFQRDNLFDSLFTNFFEDAFFYPTVIHEKVNYPLDSYEDSNGFHIEISALDIPKKDIKVTIEEGNVLKIRYDKASTEEKDDKMYYQKSICRKAFNFGYKLDSSKYDLKKIETNMKNGLLKIDIPFNENAIIEPKEIEIK